jgi:hypothetical protein
MGNLSRPSVALLPYNFESEMWQKNQIGYYGLENVELITFFFRNCQNFYCSTTRESVCFIICSSYDVDANNLTVETTLHHAIVQIRI